MRNKLNFNHLECFFTTAKTLSFSKTADLLRIAQPAVSKQIRSLEESLDFQLFLRNKKEVKLTREGLALYNQIAPLYWNICDKVDQFTSNAKELSGTIFFACLGEVGERVFINGVSSFINNHPKVSIETSFLKTKEIIELVKKGDIDIGIVHEKVIQESIRTYPIFKEELILVTAPENKNKKIDKISKLPFVAYRNNDPLLTYFIKKVSPRSKQDNLDIAFTVNSHRSMAKIVMDHKLYAVLPKLSIAEELKANKLIQVKNFKIDSNLYLIQRDLDFTDPKTELFKKHLMDYVKTVQ